MKNITKALVIYTLLLTSMSLNAKTSYCTYEAYCNHGYPGYLENNPVEGCTKPENSGWCPSN